jgi:hypothetical protein
MNRLSRDWVKEGKEKKAGRRGLGGVGGEETRCMVVMEGGEMGMQRGGEKFSFVCCKRIDRPR